MERESAWCCGESLHWVVAECILSEQVYQRILRCAICEDHFIDSWVPPTWINAVARQWCRLREELARALDDAYPATALGCLHEDSDELDEDLFATMSVLLIDDEAPIRLLCRVNLEYAGMVVSEAPDGVSGLRQARSEKPDLVFLDIQMPGLDGISVAKELRADAETRSIPIVFLSPRVEFCGCVNEFGLSDIAALAEPFSPFMLARLATKVVRRATARGPSTAESLEDLWSLRAIATTPNDWPVHAEVARWRRNRTSAGGD